jgi:hypothetical protein
MNWLTVLLSAVGDFFKGKRELKKLELEQKKEVIIAETQRIKANTVADNDIDYQTNKDKKYTIKDDILIYLFLVPVVSATVVPFVLAYQNNDFLNLNNHIKASYETLDLLPVWYKYVLGLIVIDVLGFRSFARKLVSNYTNKLKK